MNYFIERKLYVETCLYIVKIDNDSEIIDKYYELVHNALSHNDINMYNFVKKYHKTFDNIFYSYYQYHIPLKIESTFLGQQAKNVYGLYCAIMTEVTTFSFNWHVYTNITVNKKVIEESCPLHYFNDCLKRSNINMSIDIRTIYCIIKVKALIAWYKCDGITVPHHIINGTQLNKLKKLLKK